MSPNKTKREVMIKQKKISASELPNLLVSPVLIIITITITTVISLSWLCLYSSSQCAHRPWRKVNI